MLAECIEMMFIKRRNQVPTARLISFIKRLSVISLCLPPAGSLVLLNLVRKLVNVRALHLHFALVF